MEIQVCKILSTRNTPQYETADEVRSEELRCNIDDCCVLSLLPFERRLLVKGPVLYAYFSEWRIAMMNRIRTVS
jgi:hypothetical protein